MFRNSAHSSRGRANKTLQLIREIYKSTPRKLGIRITLVSKEPSPSHLFGQPRCVPSSLKSLSLRWRNLSIEQGKLECFLAHRSSISFQKPKSEKEERTRLSVPKSPDNFFHPSSRAPTLFIPSDFWILTRSGLKLEGLTMPPQNG